MALILAAMISQLNVSTPFFPAGVLKPQGVNCPAIELRGIGSTNTTTGATTYTLAVSNAPTANTLMLVTVANSKATTPDVPTLTGRGVLWTMIGTTNWGSGLYRVSVFRSMTNNTPTTDPIVAAFGGQTQTGCNMSGVQLTNVITTGNQGSGAIVQVVQTTNSTANPSVTMATLSGGGTNAVVTIFANNINGYGATSIDSGWTQFIQNGYATPAAGRLMIYATATTDNTPSITDGAQSWAGIALEIAKATCP